MSDHLDKLQEKYEKAEQAALAVQAEKDEAMQKVLDKYRERQQDLNAKAAEAQKEWMDATAAEALLDRPDGQAVADALGLTLPSSE